MSANSSAPSGEFLLSVATSSLPFRLDCLLAEPFSIAITIYTVSTVVLLLPVCVLVLYHGLQRVHQQRCSAAAAAAAAASTSHSDSFTCHLVAMEMFLVFGHFLSCCGIYTKTSEMSRVGIHLFTIPWYGEAFFQVLTCLEHYLAVVHPVVYLRLRRGRWMRLRSVSVACVWLLSVGGSVLIMFDNICVIFMLCILVPSLVVISFCCVSVLCALIRPGPGSQSRDQGRVDQSKQRAFYTIVAILVVLFLRCAWNLIWAVLYVLNERVGICVFIMSEMWINLPSSLVLPLLFLQKAGVLVCCKKVG